RRHTRFSRDWSSDVCSSDLANSASTDIQFQLIGVSTATFNIDLKIVTPYDCTYLSNNNIQVTINAPQDFSGSILASQNVCVGNATALSLLVSPTPSSVIWMRDDVQVG